MNLNKKFFVLTWLVAFLVAACGSSAEDAMMTEPAMTEAAMTEDAMMTEPAMTETAMTEDAMMTEPAMTEPAMTEEAMMDSPAWYGAKLTDVRDDSTFTIEDFYGKVILVTTMSVDCPTCADQQAQIKELHSQLGMPDDLVTISLDVDSKDDAAALKTYLDQQTFDWQFVVSPADVSEEISATLGDQFIDPSSNPIFVIDRHGAAHPMPFGLKSADDLLKFVKPFLDEGM